ncbi:MAG TPA: electron transfer flavoprotein subunit alpha/FixB family protein [Terriglobales bacterium]|nr:electron transfer flavoprotein subunit alpha/FixB family protein [Terriglobales bacterium]
MPQIFTYIPHMTGVAEDTALELAAAAHKLDPSASPIAIVSGWGPALDAASNGLRSVFAEIWKISLESLAYPNAELVRQALVGIVPRGSIVLLVHDHFGVDLGPGLSVKLDAPFVSDVIGIEGLQGSILKLVRQEFGGQFCTHVDCDISAGAVITVRPSAFQTLAKRAQVGVVVDKASQVGELTARRRYLETIPAETGDVDITRHTILVSIGRGIQGQENLAIAQELADVLGGAVSCSRPVADAKWLPKSRQVGTSGKTVKPRIYLACGISGAFQHLAGLKGNPFIIAINKNPSAPIFQAANVGVVADLLEFLPELTSRIRELRGKRSAAAS